MSFTHRLISVSFSMGSGNFEGGGNNASLDGLRIVARIDGPGGLTGMTLSAAIYGMPLSIMNQLTTAGRQIDRIAKNKVMVSAGDAQSGMSLVFTGMISYAWVDAQSQPNVAFRVEASPTALADVQPLEPTSVKGTADASTLMGTLAGQAGFGFEDNGVNVKLDNPYLWGSAGAQIGALARAAGIEHIVDRDTLAIWNPGEARAAAGNVFISPQTGMVSYPSFSGAAVLIRTIFNPQIQNGTRITVQSDITPACGDWVVIQVTHEIESNVPRGKWFTLLRAVQGKGGQDTP